MQPSTPQIRSSTKKSPSTAALPTRGPQKLTSTSLNKGNRTKAPPTSILATSGATTKRCTQDLKKHRSKNKSGLTTKLTTNQITVISSSRTATATRKAMMTTVTDTIAPYRDEESAITGEERDYYAGRTNGDPLYIAWTSFA